MNPVRLLILLTFVLYETQRAESTLTYIKSLLKKHLHTTPEPPTPINECKHIEYGANGDAVDEWSRQLKLNEKPTMIEIDEQGNVGGLIAEEQPIQNENPILLEIDDKGGVRSINSQEISVQNDHRILIELDDEGNVSTYNSEGYSKEDENPIIVEMDDKGKIVRVITKTIPENRLKSADENTSWLLGENPSENQSEGDGGKLHGVFESIKEKIVTKINTIKSKLHLRKEVVEKPVTENVQDSEFLLEEKNNNYVLPSTAAILPVSTVEPVVVSGNPIVAVSSTTAGVPVTAGSPWTTAGVPVTAGSPWTTTGSPVTASVPVTAGTPFITTGAPVIAAGPSDGYGPVQEQPQVVSIPGRRRVPFPVRTVYYSALPYPMQWFGQPQYAAVQTAFATKPQPTIENTPYYVAPVGNRNQNFGYVSSSGRPAYVAPTIALRPPGQWIRYAPANGPKYVRPVSPAPSVPYAPTRTSAVPEVPSSTTRPIAVYPTHSASVSPPPTRPQEPVTAAEDDWNTLVEENASILSGADQGSDYPSRGDVPSYAGNDGANVQYGPPEGTENGYLLMESRNGEDVVAVEKNAQLTTPAAAGTPATRSKSEKKPTDSKSEKKPIDSKSEKKPTDPKSA